MNEIQQLTAMPESPSARKVIDVESEEA
jgi:hypothetical protein